MFHMIFRKRAAISKNFTALKRSQNLNPELSFKVFNTRRPRAPLLCMYVCLSVCQSVRPSVTPAVTVVCGADEQQKLSSVPHTLYVFKRVV